MEWLSALNVGEASAYGVLVLVVFLLTRGVLITRRTAEREVESLVDGYKAKDEAHAALLGAREARIQELESERDAQADLIKRREDQLSAGLDELGPTIISMADAIQTVVLESERGGRDEMEA